MSNQCGCGIAEPHVHSPCMEMMGILMGFVDTTWTLSGERARPLGVIATRLERKNEPTDSPNA